MKLTRYKLNPSVIFIENSRRKTITEYDRLDCLFKELYDAAISSLKPGETGEFQILFVKKES